MGDFDKQEYALNAATAALTLAGGQLATCRAAVDRAQAAHDAEAGKEPPETIGSRPNPAHAAWQRAMAKLQAALDGAKAAADTARNALADALATGKAAVDGAQACLDAATDQEPPEKIGRKPNPAYVAWKTAMAKLQAAIDQARAAADVARKALDVA